jgi:hypothetical protein
MKLSPPHITRLLPGEIFVFGSNLAGIHGAGAARTAHRDFGAAWGIGAGYTGQCYAIPTKDAHLRVLPLATIAEHIMEFLRCADMDPKKEFLLTPIGCGLAGYKPADIAPLFFPEGQVLDNVSYPKEFVDEMDRLAHEGIAHLDSKTTQ